LLRTSRVVDARFLVLEPPHHPLGEIAHVDDLHGIVRPARREHLAPARETNRPIGEAITRVPRTDDVGGPNHQRAIAKRLLHFALAPRLRYTVRLGAVLRIGELEMRRDRLIETTLQIWVV